MKNNRLTPADSARILAGLGKVSILAFQQARAALKLALKEEV